MRDCSPRLAMALFGAALLGHALPCRATAPPAAVSSAPASAAEAQRQASASPDTPEVRAFRKSIRALYDLKERAFAAHDAETILTRFYAPDVISVGAGEGIFVGRDALRPLYQNVVRNNHVRIESVYTYVRGNTGWDWADFHVEPTDGKTEPLTFAILFLWAREHGAWICKGDFFVTGSLRDGKLAGASAPGADGKQQ